MPFFFQTTNASVDYRAANFVFTFDPVEVVGGSWRGVLQVDSEAAAAALRTIAGPVSETTAEEFAVLKKKWTRGSKSSVPLIVQSPTTLHEVANFVAEEEGSKSSTDTEPETAAEAVPDSSAVKLGTAEPPDELNATEATPKKRGKK